MSLQRYPKNKDSGLMSLGELPENWEVKRLKYLLAEPMKYGANESASDVTTDNPRFVRITDIDVNGQLRDETFRSLPPEVAKPYLLTEGDILLARSGATVGKSFIYRTSWGICCFAGYLIKVRVNQQSMNPQYLYYCCQTNFYWQYIKSEQIQATIQNVSAERYGNISLPCPPIKEQSSIVSFLNSETGKFDAMVKEQEKLLMLLKEKRQAVISHAVTKGLEPGIPMNDSGIDWLGQIPKGWEIGTIKYFCVKITDGAHVSPDTEDGVYCFVSTQNIGNGSIDFENCLRTSKTSFEYLVRTGCKPIIGDVLFSKDGTIGSTVVVRENIDFVVASSLIIIRPNRKVLHPEYLNYLCQSVMVKNQVERLVKGAGLPRLSIQNLLRVICVIPPLNEQQAISSFLDKEIRKIETLMVETERAIELLKERRSALISAAVTGKIDVRGLVEEVSV